MTRTILTAAALLFGASTLLGSAAHACISCEYVPEVVNTPVKSHQAKRQHSSKYNKKRTTLTRQAVPGKKRVGKSEAVAKAAPPKTQAEPAAKTDVAKSETETAPRLTGSSALIQSRLPAQQAVTAAAREPEEGGACKKFFPAVGKTLSVPCE